MRAIVRFEAQMGGRQEFTVYLDLDNPSAPFPGFRSEARPVRSWPTEEQAQAHAERLNMELR